MEKLINSFRLKVLMTLSKKTTVGSYNIATEFASIAGSQPLMTSIQITESLNLQMLQTADIPCSTTVDMDRVYIWLIISSTV
jgi:hypothetical protein